MITGYNTDVEHNGVVYHVQTEDKGLESPLILSLVYTGGAILASKRAPYDDLLATGFDEQKLAERVQRQHKLICAAIHAGRIEDLKKMSQRAQEAQHAARPVEQKIAQPPPPEEQVQPQPSAGAPTFTPPPLMIPIEEQPSVSRPAGTGMETPERAGAAPPALIKGRLFLDLLEDRLLRAGEFVTFRVRVSSGTTEDRDGVPGAEVTLKVLGTTFRPQISSAGTDQDGIAILFSALPRFTTGRAAILIRASVQGQEAELRRIILPA